MTDKKDTEFTVVDEIRYFMRDIKDKYTDTIAMRANIAAINRMLIKRNRGEELLDNLKYVVDQFEKKNINSGEINDQEK